jgi:hypothetical protein
MSQSDLAFLTATLGRKRSKTVRRERCRVVFAYLTALRDDFDRLLRVGRVIARLSPEVIAVREFERLRLTAEFILRCRLVELRLLAGMTPTVQVRGVSEIVSHLAVRIEAAVRELAEHAAQPSKQPHPSTGAA